MRPLNGYKIHPLSEVALKALAEIGRAPVPRQSINPGITNRLEAEGLVEAIDLPSPYKTVKGNVQHLRITSSGRAKLAG